MTFEKNNMTKFARNRRLYDHLFAMGLFVDPVLVDGNPDKIDSLIVATAPWTVNLLPVDVASPVKGPEVGDVVTTSVDRTSDYGWEIDHILPVATTGRFHSRREIC